MTSAERNLLTMIANVMRVQMQGVINGMAARGDGIPPKLNEQYRNILKAMNQLEAEDKERETQGHEVEDKVVQIHELFEGGPVDAA